MGTKIHQNPKTIGNITLTAAEGGNADRLEQLAAMVDQGNEEKLEKLMELLQTEEEIAKYKPYVEKAARKSILKAQYLMSKELGPFSFLRLSIMKKAAEQKILDAPEEYEKTYLNFRRGIFFMIASNIIIVAIMIYVLYRMTLN